MTTHQLKTWPDYFEAIARNEKTFEVRKNDRDFKVGDRLLLQEWCPRADGFTGRVAYREVDYILHGGAFGIDSVMLRGW